MARERKHSAATLCRKVFLGGYGLRWPFYLDLAALSIMSETDLSFDSLTVNISLLLRKLHLP